MLSKNTQTVPYTCCHGGNGDICDKRTIIIMLWYVTLIINFLPFSVVEMTVGVK